MSQQIDIMLSKLREKIAQGESLSSIAKSAGLHRNSLYGYDKPDWNPTADTIRKIEAAL